MQLLLQSGNVMQHGGVKKTFLRTQLGTMSSIMRVWFSLNIWCFLSCSITTYLRVGGGNSDAAFENCNATKVDSKQGSPKAPAGSSPLHEEFPGFASPNEVKQTGRQI